MKYLLVVIITLVCIRMSAQESTGKIYYTSKNATKNFYYIKNIKYDDATAAEKKIIDSQFPLGSTIKIARTIAVSGKAATVYEDVKVDAAFLKNQTIPRKISLNDLGIKSLRGAVKFDKSMLYLNPKKIKLMNDQMEPLRIEEDNSFTFQRIPGFVKPAAVKGDLSKDKLFKTYQASLDNYDHLWVPFTELTFTSLTIPLRYRFADKDEGLEEEFSSSVNLNFLLGFSYGNTKFIHRNKVGNKANTWKITGGVVLGTGTVVLNSANTSLASSPLASGENITKGLFTFGYGATYAYNNINLGLFLGKDYSVGNESSKWNYNKRLWLGFGVGYSLFKL